MSGFQAVTSTLLAVAAAVGMTADVCAAEADAGLRAELERVAQRRIFFGHQSVGDNVLDGVKQLAKKVGVPVRIAETKTASAVGPGTLGHAWVGENRYPLRKLQAFEQAFDQRPAGVEIALVKLCYTDITAGTDSKALFAQYRDTIERIRTKNPGVTFVHVTAPLTHVQGGPKAFVKRLLGRAPYGTIENARREEYNALLRMTYQGRDPIFDLARVESTAPDGSRVTAEWKGDVAPALAPLLTDDGHHLNAAGRLQAARELVSVLAAIPARAKLGGGSSR